MNFNREYHRLAVNIINSVAVTPISYQATATRQLRQIINGMANNGHGSKPAVMAADYLIRKLGIEIDQEQWALYDTFNTLN